MYYIPIIGAISAGKSTFLNAFLGINILETGLTTTTKFVCLIKNSQNISFYHVIPKNEDNKISLIKEGNEIKSETQIKQKIEEINERLTKKQGTKDDIFYVLEIPIKNIDNSLLLESTYFMDVPGLDEEGSEYIQNIFSIINLDDILFEIIIFDSTNIGSDTILNILKKLKSKNVLKTKNNLFILNKIDQVTKGGENIETIFKKYFYETFEDEKKNKNDSAINLNISENYFIPMNSLLYMAETKLEEKFDSLLIFEIYNYLDNYKDKFSSFFEYIKKKIEFINRYGNIEIDKKIKNLTENDLQIITKSVEHVINIFKNLSNFQSGLNLKKKNCEKEMKKIYAIHKNKNYEIIHSKIYEQIREIIKNIKINNIKDLDCPPFIKGETKTESIIYNLDIENTNQKAELTIIKKNDKFLININITNEKYENYSKEIFYDDFLKLGDYFKLFDNIDKLFEGLKETFENKKPIIQKFDQNIKLTITPVKILGECYLTIPKTIPDRISLIEDLDNFLQKTFKEIDPDNELKNYRNSLQTLRENILGRKIRISLIGNISVGKSTVLNCILGTNLLPTKDCECTYRGVIIRYKNEKEFKLYKTKLITKGVGIDQYYFFEDEKTPYCEGEINIKNFLNNKNSDKNIEDEDAYIVITGKLKIFDFIELDENIINKIEFIDLPGNDREINTFNKKEYYKKILKFSNSCIYINEPKTIQNQFSVEKMVLQYTEDKSKVCPNLRMNFIKTCIFLINKSDFITEEKDKEKIINVLIENIKRLEPDEPENQMNIAFFSGISFEYYLNIKKNFIELLEKDPTKLINNYYIKWLKNMQDDPKDYIINKILSEIEEKFDLNLEEEEVEVPDEFSNKLKEAFNITFKYKNFDEDELIEKIYSLYYQFKKKNWDETIYSSSFFNKIKNIILYSDNLQNKNLNYSISEFISVTNLLFEKKINHQDEEDFKAYNFFQDDIIPKISWIFSDKNWKIKDIIKKGKIRCLDLINDEIDNAKYRLKDAGNDIKNATRILEEKIGKITKETFQKKQDEIQNLNNEINELIEQSLVKFKSEDNEDINFNNDDNNSKKTKVILGIFSSSITGFASTLGISAVSSIGYSGAWVTLGGAIIKPAIAANALAGFFAESALACLGAGLGVGIVITVGGFFLYKYLTKHKKYKESLEKVKSQIEEKYDNEMKKADEDITVMKDTLLNKMNIQVEIGKKKININDINKWKDLQNVYLNLKLNIEKRIKSE